MPLPTAKYWRLVYLFVCRRIGKYYSCTLHSWSTVKSLAFQWICAVKWWVKLRALPSSLWTFCDADCQFYHVVFCVRMHIFNYYLFFYRYIFLISLMQLSFWWVITCILHSVVSSPSTVYGTACLTNMHRIFSERIAVFSDSCMKY